MDRKFITKFKRLNRPIRAKRLASIDTEDDSKGNLISICYYDGKEFYLFKKRIDWINFIMTHKFKGKMFIVAVNLEYDMINLFRDHWHLVELFYGARLIYAKMKDKEIYFMDSLNHYKMSVEKQGKYIGLPKLPFDPTSDKYIMRDAEITYIFADRYQKKLNEIGCEMNYTSASSALNLYKRRFLPMEINKLPDGLLDTMRKAYYGGRTEIFTMEESCKKGEEILYYDINSLYPFVMATNPFPVPDSYFFCNEIPDYGVAHVEIEYLGNDYVPYLPVRYNGKLVFPLGRFTGWWSAFELHYGVKHGIFRILKVHQAVGFRKTAVFFKGFVDYLYNMRLEAKKNNDKFMDLGLKTSMNSLYGKFGEHVESKVTVTEDGQIVEIKLEDEYYPIHTNYILSLYVTAYARTVLYEALKKVVDKGCHLLYCDTDSVIYKGKPHVLKEGSALGEFKLEGKYSEAQFYLPKAYRLKQFDGIEIVKAKGIPMKLADKFLHEGIVEVDKPVRLRESLKLKDKTMVANYWRKRPKRMKALYDKREIVKNGRDTLPHELSDSDINPIGVKEQGSKDPAQEGEE